jgi:hypothetical protein
LGLIAFLVGFVNTLIGAHVRNTMRITYFGFGPTEIRALLLLGNMSTMAFGVVYLTLPPAILGWLGPISGHDVVISFLSLAAVGMIATLGIREARLLAVEDPPPLPLPSSSASPPAAV